MNSTIISALSPGGSFRNGVRVPIGVSGGAVWGRVGGEGVVWEQAKEHAHVFVRTALGVPQMGV